MSRRTVGRDAPAALCVDRVSVRFGSLPALREVSFTAAPGERVGLVGANGAGKTTLLDVIAGLTPPRSGAVHLGAAHLSGRAAEHVARAGVARTFQSPRVAPWMTVAENVRAGRRVDAEPWLSLARLEARRDDLAGALTRAEARRLELARALAGDPRVLLLDEPFGGLSAAESQGVDALLARGATADLIVILVEHRLGIVRHLAARVLVLHLGEKIFDGAPAAMRDDPGVLAAYLGRRPPG
jgi:ABC-type branched-subunit amino acid transport system ATPase component